MVRILLALFMATTIAGAVSAKDLVPTNGPVRHRDGRTGGGDWGSATLITTIPYSDTGVTCGAYWVVDFTCGYTAGVSPDLFYQFTSCFGGTVSVSLCGSDYDTEVAIFDSNHNALACNDDFCNLQSEIDNFTLNAGSLYYIVVSGYYGSCGDYVLNISGNDCLGGPVPVGNTSWGRIKSVYAR